MKKPSTRQETQETYVQTRSQEGSPGEGNGNTLQYSCLENLRDRGAWQITVLRVARSQTLLTWNSRTHAHFMDKESRVLSSQE